MGGLGWQMFDVERRGEVVRARSLMVDERRGEVVTARSLMQMVDEERRDEVVTVMSLMKKEEN